MNEKIAKVAAFAIGVAIGSAIAWKFAKDKYKRIADEEIDSIKERYAKKYAQIKNASNEEKEEAVICARGEMGDENQDSMKALYAEILRDRQYSKEADEDNDEKGGEDPMQNVTRPYLITPDEFGERDDYETESLHYYEDGTLVDDWDNVIEDIDDIVGTDSLNHFGDYEEDSVFVRNDEQKTDYEILREPGEYAGAVSG